MAETHTVSFPGAMLRRGFWLYVWRVDSSEAEYLYVGRTGDNSSPHATAPYTRMGQHLGYAPTQNALRRHLLARNVEPTECAFHLVSHGPLYEEVRAVDDEARLALMERHVPIRNKVGALEKALAEELAAVGYNVLNTVKWKHPHDFDGWQQVRHAFAAHFPRLSRA